jgi:hypothetical protein
MNYIAVIEPCHNHHDIRMSSTKYPYCPHRPLDDTPPCEYLAGNLTHTDKHLTHSMHSLPSPHITPSNMDPSVLRRRTEPRPKSAPRSRTLRYILHQNMIFLQKSNDLLHFPSPPSRWPIYATISTTTPGNNIRHRQGWKLISTKKKIKYNECHCTVRNPLRHARNRDDGTSNRRAQTPPCRRTTSIYQAATRACPRTVKESVAAYTDHRHIQPPGANNIASTVHCEPQPQSRQRLTQTATNNPRLKIIVGRERTSGCCAFWSWERPKLVS